MSLTREEARWHGAEPAPGFRSVTPGGTVPTAVTSLSLKTPPAALGSAPHPPSGFLEEDGPLQASLAACPLPTCPRGSSASLDRVGPMGWRLAFCQSACPQGGQRGTPIDGSPGRKGSFFPCARKSINHEGRR